jgi:predicted nucleic acid-binding protein
MPKIVIADTSVFILLSKIGQLDLLQKLYSTVHTTLKIAEEFGEPLPDWVILQFVTNVQVESVLALQIDAGEASAIALALEVPERLLILDDLKARNIAKQLGIAITGTLGIIVKAKINGHISSVKPLINRIKQTNFRISPALEEAVLKEAGER